MLKKVGFAAAAIAAGVTVLGGAATASATELGHRHYDGDTDQSALANLNNLDLAHNVNVAAGVCKDNINVLGVQVPVQDVAKGISVPILSEGESDAAGEDPENCSSSNVR